MDPNLIIAEIEAACKALGQKPSTVCQRALGNALFYERVKKRLAQYEAAAEKLRSYFAQNSTDAVPLLLCAAGGSAAQVSGVSLSDVHPSQDEHGA